MKLIIRPDAAAVQALAARILAAHLRRRPDLVLGLATGRTMEAIYARLVDAHREDGLDFSRVRTFNLDEYIGLTPSDPRSYAHYMRRHLFDAARIAPERTRLPDGAAADPCAESAAYEAAIRAAGGLDVQLLGLGENGHIGFNEPLSSLASRSRPVVLDPATRAQNAAMFGGDPANVPLRAITMGIGTILDAQSLLTVATGAAKAEALAASVEGPVSASMPGSALQLHADCLVIADEDAASRLARRDLIDGRMAHDPVLAALLREETA